MAVSACSAQLLCPRRPCSARCKGIVRVDSRQPQVVPRSAVSQQDQQARAGRSSRLCCRAAGFSSQPAGGDQTSETVQLPNSREEAVRQAAAAIAAQLTTAAGSGKGKAKGFTEGGDRKLSVDVPVLESGAAATLQLAQEILAALPKQLRQQFTIVTCEEGGGSPGPAGGSSSGGVATLSLQQCVAEGRDLDGCLLIAGPSPTQLDAVMRLLAYWRGPGAVVLNADWSSESAPVEQRAFLKSIEAVYCFLPLVVKVLFINQEGAVFKWCTGGSPAATPWRVLGKQGSRLAPIGRMLQRPTNEDLEATFYNAFAVENPLNKGVKGVANVFRKLTGGGGGGGGKKDGR